jgi:hypothetical protein
MFLQQVHGENFSQKNRQNFPRQFFHDVFVLSRFRAFISDGSSKTLKTNCKEFVPIFLQNNQQQKSKTDFFSIFLITFLGIWRGESENIIKCI